MNEIDLRSDTVTLPTPAMRQAMSEALVGDDVYGEDPTVNRLEEMTAERLGLEAGLFASSGTQSNLLGLLAHCDRGDEYIVGDRAHTYWYEGGGAAVLGSIQPQPITFEPDGTLDLDKVKSVIKPDDSHFARTKLLCLENTRAGRVLPIDYLASAKRFSEEQHLGLHLDGARVFNAAVALDVPVDHITAQFDTVSVCLSKGLGAPVGSVLCGSRPLVQRARRWRKVLGGGMRQAGIVAAAGIIALESHVSRLSEDHANARRLAENLAAIDALAVDLDAVETNILFVHVPEERLQSLVQHLRTRGIRVSPGRPMRLVTHLGVNERDIEKVTAAFGQFFESAAA
jgi:threonine aldolase